MQSCFYESIFEEGGNRSARRKPSSKIPSFLITVVLKGGVPIIGLYEKQSFI